MPYAWAKRNRDRRESDLLLDIVLAHMVFSSAKTSSARKEAHATFKEAVHILAEFVTSEDLPEADTQENHD